MRKRPLIWVEWEDIAAFSSWRDESDSPNWTPLLCESVGWKLPSNRRNLIIVSTRGETAQCTDRQVIPRGCIKKIRRLD